MCGLITGTEESYRMCCVSVRSHSLDNKKTPAHQLLHHTKCVLIILHFKYLSIATWWVFGVPCNSTARFLCVLFANAVSSNGELSAVLA